MIQCIVEHYHLDPCGPLSEHGPIADLNRVWAYVRAQPGVIRNRLGRLRRSLQHAAAPAIVLNPSGNVVFCNARARDCLHILADINDSPEDGVSVELARVIEHIRLAVLGKTKDDGPVTTLTERMGQWQLDISVKPIVADRRQYVGLLARWRMQPAGTSS